VLSALYRELTGEAPRVPEAPASPPGLSRREARAYRARHQVASLERMTRENIEIDSAQLETLGRRRGEAIERELVRADRLEPTRVLLSQKAKAEAHDGKVRYELRVE
jgi:hypothetical protein